MEENIKKNNEEEFYNNDQDLLSCFSEVGPIENENSELENKKSTFNDKTVALDKKKKFNYPKKRKRNYNEYIEKSIKENLNVFGKPKILRKK